MSVRIHLHTLGDASITVGGKEVRPTSPVVFAALLYFCLERGHRVPRTALQELLFPDTDERSGAHSMRQLLYKLRQLGVPLQSHETALELPAQHVSDDFPTEDVATNHTMLSRLSAGLLPGYEPRVSAAFDEWLDERRALAATRARKTMLDALARSREAGDHFVMETIASAILRLDPLNEEATLVHAEVLALSGQKHDAVRVLERYSAEVGETSPHLRIPPDLLRRRIAERFHVSDRSAVPMLGRQEELAFLLAQFSRADQGQGTVSVVWGDAGIGKTRLVQEFSSHLVLKNARVESAHCQPFDRERPLGALVDLVPKLLQARGALGVSPESLQQLKRLSGEIPPDQPRETHPELTAARIREAIVDLLLCVSAERPLVLFVEDAHWLDDASLRLLLGLVPGQSARLHLVITMRDRPHFPTGARISESVLVRQLTPLSDAVAADLLTRTLGTGFTVETPVREQCVALAAGNPLFICTVAEHLRLRGAAPSAQAGIADLLKQRVRILDAPTLLLLRTIAALGNHATPDRLRACTGMSLEVELLALQDLADRGLVARQDGSIRCAHDLLTEVVLADASPPIKTALYERVATVLEEDGTAGKQVQLLWSCAESWRQAENRARAYDVLRKCASFAGEVGQPQFSCLALTKAQELTDGPELLRVVEDTILVAEKCVDADVVLHNVHRHRELSSLFAPGTVNSHVPDLAEINALRWRLKSTWAYAPRLRAIAHDNTASLEIRLRAAKVYLTSAEQELRKADAVDFFSTLDEASLGKRSPAAWHHLRLLYHASVGDLDCVGECARALEHVLHTQDEWHQCSSLGNMGTAWHRAGEAARAIEALQQCVAKAEKFGFTSMFMNYAAQLCIALFTLGEDKAARSCHDYAATVLRTTNIPLAPAFIAVGVERALLEEDHQTARLHLTTLERSLSGQDTPYNRRFAIGYDVLIRRLEARLDARAVDFGALEDLDRRGRDTSEHDYLAVALAIALLAATERNKAVLTFSEYLRKWRRERHAVSPLLIAQLDPAFRNEIYNRANQLA